MKQILILLFTINSIVAWCAVDPAPEHVEIKIDSEILKNGAYISLVDIAKIEGISTEDRIQLIRPETETYYFMFPSESIKIKIQFKDSTEKVTSIINKNSRYSIYKINLDHDNKLAISDITNYIEKYSLLKFIAFTSLVFLIIKILPTWIIFYPKDSLTFMKYYGLAQLAYSIVFSILIFFFHGNGLLISIFVFLISIAIDNKILHKIYHDSKKAGRISVSMVITIILTILFYIIQLFAFVLLV
jgi:hypothetical protein